LGLAGVDRNQGLAPDRPTEPKAVTAEVFDDKNPLVIAWKGYLLSGYHLSNAVAYAETRKASLGWMKDYLAKWEQYINDISNIMPIAVNSGVIQSAWNWIKQEYPILEKYPLVTKILPVKNDLLVPFVYTGSGYKTSRYVEIKKGLNTMTKVRDEIKKYVPPTIPNATKTANVTDQGAEQKRTRALSAANNILTSLQVVINEVDKAVANAKVSVKNLETTQIPNAEAAVNAATKAFTNDQARLLTRAQGYVTTFDAYQLLSNANKVKQFPAMAMAEIVGTVLFLVAVAQEDTTGASTGLKWSTEAAKQVELHTKLIVDYKAKQNADLNEAGLMAIAYNNAISQAEKDAMIAKMEVLQAAINKGSDDIASAALWLTQLNQNLSNALAIEKEALAKSVGNIEKAMALVKEYGIDVGSSVADAINKINAANKAAAQSAADIAAMIVISGKTVTDILATTKFDEVNLPIVTQVDVINTDTTKKNDETVTAEGGGITLLAIIGAIAYGVSH